jgi:hypothetical protein
MAAFGEFNKITTLIDAAIRAMRNLSDELTKIYKKNIDLGNNAYYGKVEIYENPENSENQNPNISQKFILYFTNGKKITIPRKVYLNEVVFEAIENLKNCTEAVLKEEERLDVKMKDSITNEISRMEESAATPAAGGRTIKRKKGKKSKKRHCKKSKKRYCKK